MTLISYYTKNTPYKGVFESTLKPSLMKFNLDYIVEEVPNLGSWKANTDYKPTFILKKLQKLKEDVVWLDVDASIEQYPSLLFNIPKEFDIALHKLDWNKQYNKPGEEILSGTLFIRNNDISKTLLENWIGTLPKHRWEQEALKEVLNIPYFNLPAEYCTVIDFDNKIPSYISNPVIVHHQASRKLRRHIR
jgi:hypothetical protein